MKELEAFELVHGLTLPAEYREWVTWVGNGGVGPDNGMYPLSDWDLVFGERLPGDSLKDPFPYTEGIQDATRDGTITLSSTGSSEHFLVVNGPCAGEVWVDDEYGLFPSLAGGYRLGLYDWIDRWLTRSIRHLKS